MEDQITIGILTVSDRVSRGISCNFWVHFPNHTYCFFLGEAQDQSGPAVAEILQEKLSGAKVVSVKHFCSFDYINFGVSNRFTPL